MGWIRGTTPTLRCRIRAAVDLGQADNVYVTISQGCDTITKTGDDVSADGQVVSVWLSQEESLRLRDGVDTEMQVNWTVTSGGKTQRMAAKCKTVRLDKQLLERVIT